MIIFRWILYLVLLLKIPLFLLMVTGIFYFVAYRLRLLGFGPKKSNLSDSAEYGSRLSRIVEALIMTCVLFAAMMFLAIVQFNWFKTETFSEIMSGQKFVIALILISVVVTFLVTLKRTTRGFWTAVILCFIVFSYGVNRTHKQSLLKRQNDRKAGYTFIVNDYPGADIWINDIYLGKSPVDILPGEFRKKVQSLDGQPDEARNEILYGRYDYRNYGGWGGTTLKEVSKIDMRDGGNYYVRMRFNGEVGYTSGSGSSSSNDHVTYGLGGYFPGRDGRLEKLLDVARMMDYEVDDKWLEVFDSYGKNAWDRLYSAAYLDWFGREKMYYRWLEPEASEPGMLKVMDAGARWRYGIDAAVDEKSAWRVFVKLCAAADSAKDYGTNSLIGHALGMILPKLDQEQFVDCALHLVKTKKFEQMANGGYFDWQFKRIGPSYGSSNHNKFGSPSDYLIVDAIWRLDEYLDSIDDSTPNIIERQISKAIVYWRSHTYFTALRMAAQIGGQEIAEYIEKSWKENLRGNRKFDITSQADGVNSWVILITELSGDEGKQLRWKYRKDIKEAIGKLGEHKYGEDALRWGRLDFLSMDSDEGQFCIGAEYWPEYFDMVKKSKDNYQNKKISRLWNYLVRLEPVMDAETYIQCLPAVGDSYGHFRDALTLLEVLPSEKRVKVLEGVKKEIKPEYFKNHGNEPFREGDIKFLNNVVDKAIADCDDRKMAEYVFNDKNWKIIYPRTQKDFRKGRPGHVVGEMMAVSDDAKLREGAVAMLADFPTKGRLELLNKLAEDADENVSLLASEAIEELNYFKGHLDVLRPGAGNTGPSELSKVTEVEVRIYEDLKPDSKYNTIREPVQVLYSVQELKRNGSVELYPARIDQDSLEDVDWPDKGYAVFCGADQTDEVAKQRLGDVLQVWPLSALKPYIDSQGYTERLKLCDAAGNAIPNWPLTVEARHHKTHEMIWVSGWMSDNDGMLQTPKVQGRYTFWAFLFDHPDYGSARLDRNSLYDVKEIVVPLLKAGAKKYDRALFGKVVDSDGNAIKGARVEITGLHQGYHRRSNSTGKTVFTDKDGRFTFYPTVPRKGSQIPPKGNYGIRVTAPNEMGIPPYSGVHPNGQEQLIKMGATGVRRTFSFETKDGPITDYEILKWIKLHIKKTDGTTIDLKREFWDKGAVLPLGKYEVKVRGMAFIPVEITKDSPEHIIFCQEPDKTFTGRIVHGITGEPMANVFVIDSGANCSKEYSELTKDQWKQLRLLGPRTEESHETAKIVSKINRFDSILRTDQDGMFEFKKQPQSYYRFIAFDENFLPLRHHVNPKDVYGETDIDMGELKLMPAARVKFMVDSSEPIPVSLRAFIDEYAPEWEKDFRGDYYSSSGSWDKVKEPRFLYVPAGVKVKLSLEPPGRKWSTLWIEKPVYLEQGQELDLGTVKFLPSIKVVVKVVDADGKPLEGVSIVRYHEIERGNHHIGYTDTEGKIETFVYVGMKGQFRAGWQGKTIAKPIVTEEMTEEVNEIVITFGEDDTKE